MPRVSEAHTEARREQILRAALACFARKGVHPTTVRDICAEAGLSAGAVYNYFPAKQDIVDAVFDASLAENAALFAALEEMEDPVAMLEAVRDASFGSLDDPEHREIARAGLAVVAEAMRDAGLAERYAGVQRDMAGRLGQLVAAAQARKALDPSLDPAQVGRLLLAVHEGWRIQKLLDPDADTRGFLAVVNRLLGLPAS